MKSIITEENLMEGSGALNPENLVEYVTPDTRIEENTGEIPGSVFKSQNSSLKMKKNIKFDEDMKILQQIIKERAERRYANNQMEIL